MEEILQLIAEPLGALLLALVNAGIILAIRWLNAQTKSARVSTALAAIGEVAHGTVARLNKQVVEALKNDGRFDEMEKQQIKQTALNSINKQLKPEVVKSIGYIVEDLKEFIDGKVELAVADAKLVLPPPGD